MSSGRILVVDDDPQIRRVLRTTLIAQGYEVDDAHNGGEALEKMREDKFDLVVLDVNMPGMSGLEACRSIRNDSEVAVIMLTVRNSEADKVEALDAGADDYVTKPFSSPELLARIRAALRRLPQAPDTAQRAIALDDVEIDFSTRCVKAAGKEVRLTPMVAHPNVALSHRKLLQAVWGPDYSEEVEYLRVFVNQLRKKIERNPSRPRYLLTEPWVGYRFSLPD